MHLPTFPRAMPVTRRVQTDFRGYDHRPGCPEGGIRLSPGQGVSVFARGRVLGRRIGCMCAYGQGADDAEKG